MKSTIHNLILVCSVFVCFAASNAFASIIYENTYTYSQNGSSNFGNTAAPTPLDINTMETTPISSIAFDVRSLPASPVELKAGAGLSVNIDQRNSQVTWNDISVSATAKSSLVDFGFVQGVGGAGSGLIEFTWAVTGISEIMLDATGPNALIVSDLSTVGLLSSSIPSDVADLFPNDQADDLFINGNGLNPTIESVVADSSGFESFFVPWSAGEEVPIFFELLVNANLEVINADAAGFSALVDGDFTNTAALDSVVIYDADGSVLNGASLVGRDGFEYVVATSGGTDGGTDGGGGTSGSGAVPEPSTYAIWITMIGIGALSIRRRNRD